jgi:hypothetical protein
MFRTNRRKTWTKCHHVTGLRKNRGKDWWWEVGGSRLLKFPIGISNFLSIACVFPEMVVRFGSTRPP